MIEPSDIRSVPLFADLEPRHLRRLAVIAGRRRFTKGATIFSEGDRADGLHVVLEGRVLVLKLSPEGKQQVLHSWGPGEPFGEVAVFSGRRFPAHAQALEETTTLFLPRDGLVEVVRADPELALALLGILSLRLRRMADLIESVSLKEVPARLASYLLLLEERQGERVTLDLSKGLLASHLGTIPETLSRVLGKMTRDGMLAAEGGRDYRILDREALAELAAGERRLGTRSAEGGPGA